MAILVDEARWPWRGDLWAHLVTDSAPDELHTFAAALGMRRLAFQGDHYDVDRATRQRALALGAQAVPSRVLVRRLRAAGLRRRGARPPRWLTVGEAVVPDDLGPDELAMQVEPLLAAVDGRAAVAAAEAVGAAGGPAPGGTGGTWHRAVASAAVAWIDPASGRSSPRSEALEVAVFVRPAAGAVIIRGAGVAPAGPSGPGTVVVHRSGDGPASAVELLWGDPEATTG